jgi:uncharacterized protein (DUF934 family)
MRIISGTPASRSWRRLDAGGELPPRVPGEGVLATLAGWRERREQLLALGIPLAVELGPADDPAALAGDLRRLALIAIRFPAPGDGRGLSLARLLREHHGYAGELRATGGIAADQLWFLARCGFDAVELPPGMRVGAARASLDDLPALGATSAERAQRILRRRSAA